MDTFLMQIMIGATLLLPCKYQFWLVSGTDYLERYALLVHYQLKVTVAGTAHLCVVWVWAFVT